ncbi:hypothetical protein DRO37_07155 [Candidatus Bathyarchaeota archaeon]|nr:MAG: hypothetical protein DRO37_07155 [Candidatus Bathyarchaeota archaeon]
MSQTEKSKFTVGFWGTDEILFAISFSLIFKTSLPSRKTAPSVGFRRLFMILSRVVFPEPLGPMIPMKSPFSAENLIFSRILLAP